MRLHNIPNVTGLGTVVVTGLNEPGELNHLIWTISVDTSQQQTFYNSFYTPGPCLKTIWGCCANAQLGNFARHNAFNAIHDCSVYGQLFLLGDQIYADPLYNAWMRRTRVTNESCNALRNAFVQYYIETLGTPSINRVMSSVSTIMINDDHEITDDDVRAELFYDVNNTLVVPSALRTDKEQLRRAFVTIGHDVRDLFQSGLRIVPHDDIYSYHNRIGNVQYALYSRHAPYSFASFCTALVDRIQTHTSPTTALYIGYSGSGLSTRATVLDRLYYTSRDTSINADTVWESVFRLNTSLRAFGQRSHVCVLFGDYHTAVTGWVYPKQPSTHRTGIRMCTVGHIGSIRDDLLGLTNAFDGAGNTYVNVLDDHGSGRRGITVSVDVGGDHLLHRLEIISRSRFWDAYDIIWYYWKYLSVFYRPY